MYFLLPKFLLFNTCFVLTTVAPKGRIFSDKRVVKIKCPETKDHKVLKAPKSLVEFLENESHIDTYHVFLLLKNLSWIFNFSIGILFCGFLQEKKFFFIKRDTHFETFFNNSFPNIIISSFFCEIKLL